MTPEERARADAITQALSQSAKNRRLPQPAPFSPPAPDSPPATTGNGLRFAAFFALAVAIHIAGFIAYNHYSEVRDKAARQEEERRLAAEQELIDATREKALAQAREGKLLAQIAALRQSAASQPARIEYNVYPDPHPAPRTVYAPQQQQPSPAPVPPPAPAQESAPTRRDRTEEHRAAAIAYVLTKKGAYVQTSDVTPVPGWEGRYRTTGEAYFYRYSSKTPSPRKFEVLTQENGSVIVASDLTIKW